VNTYHLLHFIPDLTTGTRFTLGAVVAEGGAWRWVEAGLLPPTSHLSPKKQAVLELGLQRLRREPTAGLPQDDFPEDFDLRRPPLPRLSHLGNHFHTDIPQVLPEEISEPARWIQQNRLPRAQPVPQPAHG
jgi:hypothetical protein